MKIKMLILGICLSAAAWSSAQAAIRPDHTVAFGLGYKSLLYKNGTFAETALFHNAQGFMEVAVAGRFALYFPLVIRVSTEYFSLFLEAHPRLYLQKKGLTGPFTGVYLGLDLMDGLDLFDTELSYGWYAGWKIPIRRDQFVELYAGLAYADDYFYTFRGPELSLTYGRQM